VLYSPAIAAALAKLFAGPATCFQSLHFFVGSEQAIHQDTAYVVIKEDPLAFVGIWIALEDIQPGTGELSYYEQSHLIPPFHYDMGGRLHFNHEIDTHATHSEHLEYLRVRSEVGGMPLRRFTPAKGDALVWHAQLAHGGSPRTAPGSRKSLVGHYTPVGKTPHYFSYLPQERQRYFRSRNGRGWFSSFNSPSEV
jgi:ectoine hydroxylase-related dioxygenase (phytanoyl-CoA dioxygenase family)